MRSLPIVHVQSFAQSRLALRAISDNYGHVGKYTDVREKRVKTGWKMVSYFLGDIFWMKSYIAFFGGCPRPLRPKVPGYCARLASDWQSFCIGCYSFTKVYYKEC
jgi:hypothetical protein